MSKRRIIIRGALLSLALVIFYVFIVLPANHFINDSRLGTRTNISQEDGIVFVNHNMYGLFTIKTQVEKQAYIGGFPIAMALYTDGVIVEEISKVDTAFGKASPSSQLQKGDFLTELNGIKISRTGDVSDALKDCPPKVTALVIRGGENKSFEIQPALEEFSNKYRLGIVVRDYILGIGMVSYVKEDGSFGALGHLITDHLAGKVPIKGGNVFNCEELSVVKGQRGIPGEFRVKINSIHNPIGKIYKNAESGIFGKFDSPQAAQTLLAKHHDDNSRKLYGIAPRKKVSMGNAYMYTTVGGKTDFYTIEIIKAINQTSFSPKGMIVRVTDKRLIDKTGGIIQGMSGSPIIQDGLLVGAVTHVFINDPAKGYGIYMDFMCGE